MEKHIEHGKKLCHNCIDFKKAFDSVYTYAIWYNGLWNEMRNCNIDEHLISIIENLYKKSNSAEIVNDILSYEETYFEHR